MSKVRTEQVKDANGVLLLDKSEGWSSTQVLGKAKSLLATRKGGHTGSLDPIATGLLPLCFGEATKVAGYFLNSNKRYLTTVRLGESTDSGDREGKVTSVREVRVTKRKVRKALKTFVGEYAQTPPMYSAVKVQGKRLYKYARKGIEMPREPRNVKVYELNLLSFQDRHVEIDLHCSSGFYVRVLAHEFGELLNCGAHVESLRRLGVGHLQIDDSVTLEELEGMQTVSERRKLLIPGDEALAHLPKVNLTSDAAYYLCRGQTVRASDLPTEGVVRLYEGSAGFLGLGTSLGDGRVAPKRLFHAN